MAKQKHWLVKINDKFPPPFKRRHKKKITDWITSRKPICRRHPINLNNNITDISQKKDLQQALSIQLSIAYLCDTNNKNSEKIFYCSTLDALKTFEWHKKKQSSNKSIMSSKGKKYKMLQSKKARQKSTLLTSVNHRTPSLIWAHSNFWTWMDKTTRLSKVTAPKCDFSMHLV